MGPADYRWYLSLRLQDPAPECHRTAYIAPEITTPLRALPNGASAIFHDRYWENPIGRTSPLPGLGVKEIPWRVSELKANSFNCLKFYVLAVNDFDAPSITQGGYVIGTLGTEQWVGRFAQAFRALPAVRFRDVSGLEDPVRVRQAVVDGKTYFYVLNCLPVTVDLSVDLAPGAQVTDTALARPAGEGASLRVQLQPFESRSYVSASGQPVILRGPCAQMQSSYAAWKWSSSWPNPVQRAIRTLNSLSTV